MCRYDHKCRALHFQLTEEKALQIGQIAVCVCYTAMRMFGQFAPLVIDEQPLARSPAHCWVSLNQYFDACGRTECFRNLKKIAQFSKNYIIITHASKKPNLYQL